MDHIYLRLAWSYLEPEEGRYNWKVIDEVIEKWTDLGLMVLGAAAAFATGFVSIGYLLRVVRARKLWIFSVYCALVGAAVLAASLL